MSSLASHSQPDPDGGPTAGPSLADRISFAAFVAALLFLAFLGGAFVMLLDIFPARPLSDAYRGGQAYIAKAQQSQDPLTSDFWQLERRPETGVTVNAPEAQPGYTLYTSGHGSEASLIALDGTVLQTWKLPFSAIWNETSPVKNPQRDPFLYWRKAHLLPNGDLLALFVATGDTPWGYGMVKLDKDSNVVWSYLGQTHHDFDLAPDGRIFGLTHQMRNKTFANHTQLTVPRLDDFLVVLAPDGREMKKVSILDALVNSGYDRLLNRVVWYNKHDFIHTNNVDYIDAEKAAALPFAKEGQVLLSFRDIDTIAVLDIESERIVWARRGSWLAQHDPDILPNGHILLYDNLGSFGEGGRTRILEIDPVTGAEVWSYAGNGEIPFDSEARGAQERQPNGNTLITESHGGRLFEVTPDGRIVWEFLNPVRASNPADPDEAIIPIVSWGQRISPQALDPAFREELAAKTNDNRS
ncbi:arylsulfotransferase family protein [Pelagibius sp. 7325]|uniref:arylsulfotransferase family protein n=1 Tax=Pelagibius sp. 7325 TaxID=3131994 RepID=UPI0030EE9C76